MREGRVHSNLLCKGIWELKLMVPTSAAAEQSQAHTTARSLLFRRCTS